MRPALPLAGGRVLLLGTEGDGSRLLAEMRDLDGTYRTLPSPAGVGSTVATVLLPDGRIVLLDRLGSTASLFDPATESFSTIEMPAHLGSGSATALADGRVLVVFGPDWVSPGRRDFPPGPMVLDPDA